MKPSVILPGQSRDCVHSGNATVFGDKMVTSFHKADPDWYVQAWPGLDLEQLTQKIICGEVAVNRPYVFIWIGTEFIRTATKLLTHKNYGRLVWANWAKNNSVKIFPLTVLPRPIDNQQAKPFLVDINRYLTSMASAIQGKVPHPKPHIKVILVSLHHSVNRDFCGHSRFVLWHESLTTFVS